MDTITAGLGLKPTNKETAYRTLIENGIISREMFNFLCGDMIGYGISRMVFDYSVDPRYVIKIETDNYNANVMEWNIWQHVQHTEFAKWFAPCDRMSRHGTILIQKKVIQPKDRDGYPDKVPAFFTDMKYNNWGKIGSQYVCCDYASCLLLSTGLTKKMKKASWWEEWGAMK